MAKFIIDDHNNISGDRWMNQHGYEVMDMRNTNRDKLVQMNHYDLLIKIQKYLNKGGLCVLDSLSNEKQPCIINDGKRDCETCVQTWLNRKQ